KSTAINKGSSSDYDDLAGQDNNFAKGDLAGQLSRLADINNFIFLYICRRMLRTIKKWAI
ncbi:MAG: hypothetical protein HY738_19700, partial [Bacteroidia bacterium]|nr:hypothetical protein [Bacteroidia bacterium]